MGNINGLIYDIEIIKCIPTKAEKKNPKLKEAAFEYCFGWEDFGGMGIACVCVFDMWELMPRVFTKGNFGEMMELFKSRTEIIGFNSLKFDDNVMKANGFDVKTTYDLLHMIRFVTGEPEVYDRFKSYGGMKLDQLLHDNKLPGKSGNGKDAPKQWQAGQYGKVIDYCLGDVMGTYRLLKKRNDIYVGSYGKNYKLPELPSLREEAELREKMKEQEERNNWGPSDGE